MEHGALVSVIVPIYNARDYLEECFESIINQTYTELEVLLIDDGSTDGTSGLCDWLAQKDARVNVIHQANMGAATARKNAILRAKGEYICFVDADDQIDSRMIVFFVENIGKCDLITSGCHCEDAPNQYHERVDSFEEGIYDTEEAMKYIISNMITYQKRFEDGLLPYLCNKMFRASIVKEAVIDIETSIVYAEDRDLLFRCVLKSKAIRITHENLYYYRYREKSVMRTVNERFMYDLNGLYLSLAKVFKKHPMQENLMHQLQLFIVSRIYAITYCMRFSADTQMIRYAFPFPELEKDSKIILYGAGRVGTDYYRQIFSRKLVNLVLWVDKSWEERKNNYTPVSSLEEIMTREYDFVIIAVTKKELADEIRRELIQKGVAEEKILWRMPVIATV